MDSSGNWSAITVGADVFGSDEAKVGTVIAVETDHLVVEKGLFFPTEYSVPRDAVATVDGDRVYLAVSKDEALNQRWEVGPAAGAGAGPAASTTAATATSATTTAASAATDAGPAEGTVPFEHDEESERTRLAAEPAVVVPVHEEELLATTHQREIGQVQIEKSIVVEEQVLEVPVTDERIRVQRHAVDRPATAGEAAFEEGVIEVSVRGEEVQLQKQTRVAEEVEIGKEAVQRTERVADTIRREEVHVEEVGNTAPLLRNDDERP